MAITFTEEQLAQHEQTFKSLKSFEEKFEFWDKVLGLKYSTWSILSFQDRADMFFTQNLIRFFIQSATPEDTEVLNRMILDEIRVQESVVYNKKLINFDILKEKIDREISEAVRPKAILEKQIRWVEELINQQSINEADIRTDNIAILKGNEIKKSWLLGYNEYYLYGREADYKRLSPTASLLIPFHNGNEIAQYREYLENRISNPTIKRVSYQNRETTLKQQLLLLRFTGVLDLLKDWKSKDREHYLATLLNRSPQKIKQALIYLYYDKPEYEIWTESNLNFLIDHFSNIGQVDKANSIKQELELLKQKQNK